MPPSATQIACPNCRMPVTVNLEQLFDVGQDPSAKNRFISGRFNLINCPNCRYQGQMSTVILYHDPDKELFMSYVPMELGLPQAEQERLIGRLMNDVINKLPQEKRKGYLLNPKPALTLQGLLDRVLEGEGITKEVLDAQKAKTALLQQLASAPEDQLPALVKQHDAELDYTFFQILTLSLEATTAGGNQAGAQRLLNLRQKLLELSSFGAQARKQQQVLETVAHELEALGDKLTQDKLLELVLKASEETAVAYATLVRGGMDYAFFEALTRRIDKTEGAEKERLTKVRDTLLQVTQEVDAATQAQMAEAASTLRTLLAAPDLKQAIADNLPRLDDTFLAVLNANIEAAQRASRADVVTRLNDIGAAIMQAMQASAPPEVRFINELLQTESDEAAEALLKGRASEINQALVDAMTYIVDNLRQNNQGAMADRLDKLRGSAVEQLMTANWKK